MEDSSNFPQLKNLLELKKRYDAPSLKDLSEAYKGNADKEKLYIWAADNFATQIRHKFPLLKPLCLVLNNECGIPKLACTFIKPTVLPFDHLFGIEECSKFVSDFIQYCPGKVNPPESINSPTMVLATQLGSSIEISCILVSFLSGFGFNAFVVVGFVEEDIYNMDLQNREYLSSSDEDDEQPNQKDKEKGLNQESFWKYKVPKPRVVESKYTKFLQELKDKSNQSASFHSRGSAHSLLHGSPSNNDSSGGEEEDKCYFHAWVYVEISSSETGFFIEATSGNREDLSNAAYVSINSIWNSKNYWLCKNDNWKKQKKLNLNNSDDWIPFISNLEATTSQSENLSLEGTGSKDLNEKRLLTHIQPWLNSLDVPKDCYDLMYRLGQKTSHFSNVKVEYYAPYLLKDGLVRRVQKFDEETSHIKSVFEKFSFRTDKLTSRETYPEKDLVVERFGKRRKDQMKLHAYLRPFHTRTMEFYLEARLDKLVRRISKAWELEETFEGREDGLKDIQVQFTLAEKKFGPAETSKSGRDIVKIIEKYEKPKNDHFSNPIPSARILNSKDIYERTFDFENNRIFLKFFHEKGQIFCKTAEFSTPEELNEEDVKVFIVDPRDPKPCLHELRDLYKEQLTAQTFAIHRVEVSEGEINALLEDRMRELSANELNVWLFDIKRNVHVSKGRQEKSSKKREKDGEGDSLSSSTLDVEIDFLAPYLAKFEDLDSLTKPQATQIRDECLNTIRMSLKNKEEEISQQIANAQKEIEANKHIWTNDCLNSKKFFLNVLEMRLKRQKTASLTYYTNAENKVINDSRIKHHLK